MKRPLYRVAREHNAAFTYAMVATEGDIVSVGKEDPEMPGWFWCKDSKSVEMWVPSTHLRIEGTTGVFNQPYNSIELTVEVGDVVQLLGEMLGWAECLDAKWRYGWVPSNKLEPA